MKLLAEIDSVDTTDFTSVNSKMPYLDAVIMEINRLYPTVHATLRVVNRETTLASGKKPVDLKPGMLIYVSYLNLHTSPKYWGPDAGQFVPERFLGGCKKDQPFMAFGYGPRSCVSLPSLLLTREEEPISSGWIQICHSCSQNISYNATQNLPRGRQGLRPRNETLHSARDHEASGRQGLAPALGKLQINSCELRTRRSCRNRP